VDGHRVENIASAYDPGHGGYYGFELKGLSSPPPWRGLFPILLVGNELALDDSRCFGIAQEEDDHGAGVSVALPEFLHSGKQKKDWRLDPGT